MAQISGVNCGMPDIVQHAILDTTGPEGRTFLFDHVLNYTCLSGYEYSAGDLIRVCQANGNFTGIAPLCTGTIVGIFRF